MFKDTFDSIFTYENLYKAHIKGRSSKRDKRSIVRFEMGMLEKLYEIYERLKKGHYNVGNYHTFVVYEPKKREIQTLCYSERVVQHALCDNFLVPYFTSRAILDNCVCQVGKGMHFALKRFEAQLRKYIKKHGQNGYVLKCDIKKYFPSIPHEKLKEVFSPHIHDEKLKTFVCEIVDSFHTSPVYLKKYGIKILVDENRTGQGIPIGNQTSQIFGMFFLDKIDRLMKEKLGIKIYSCYMDDFVLVHESKEFLQNCLKIIQKEVADLDLYLNPKTQIFPIKNGLTYLGFRYQVSESGKLIKKAKQKTIKRFYGRIKLLKRAYSDGAIDKNKIKQTLCAYHGHLVHANCYQIEKKLISKLVVDLNE